jgi:hypothetical protein
MKEDKSDINPPDKKLPASLDRHLRELMPDRDLNHFREQLPAEFLSDASEGLDQVKDTKQLENVLQRLNQQMHHQLSGKKYHKKRHKIGDLSWSYWAIIIIFLFIFAGYLVIRMLLSRKGI